MSITIIRGAEVNRPDTTPLSSSVLDHATVKNVSGGFGWQNNEGLWPSYNCLDTLVPTGICPDPLAGYKQFSTVGWMPGFEFAYYGGAQCNALGLDMADQSAEVKRVALLNEGKGVEMALLYNRFVATDSDAAVEWDAPVDLGTSASIALALARLEGYAAANYAGVPTIHMPRAAASLLNERIVWEGGKAYTRAGSKVAIGGGYDDETMLATSTWAMYATGEVYVERSEQVSLHSYVLPSDGSGTGSDENGLAHNTSIALAERMFRVAVDCMVVKVTATVTP